MSKTLSTSPSRVIVSNRLPISVKRAASGELTYTASDGGLATAISSLDSKPGEQVWVGWPGIAAEELSPAERTAITRRLHQDGCHPVFLTKVQIEGFYDGYSNDTLWPLFHYFQDTTQFRDETWQVYREVNRQYARAVLRYAAADSTVWIHDYHLMLLPGLVRAKRPDALIGFFLHTPFPSFEIFRLLPERRAILEGLLGADLVGFHIYDYARHFISSVQRVLGLKSSQGTVLAGDRPVVVDAFPIGINYDKFATSASLPETITARATVNKQYKGQKLVLSIDRLDYSKGIDRRLDAYERFLADNPDLHKQVSLFVLAVPSRVDVASYQRLRDAIELAISRINGRYGSVDWTPIRYQFQNLPFAEVAALYGRADVMLVTPLRDGMNLVAKEYVAVQQGGDGVLILSELTGAADELPEASYINPNDIKATAGTIRKALMLPSVTRRKRLKAMQSRLKQYDVARWASDFLEQLSYTHQARAIRRSKLMLPATRTNLIDDFHKAKKRAIFLDYDGTLMPYVDTPDPGKAAPPRRLLEILRRLCSQPETEVAIVSGRPRVALEQWFAKTKLPLTLVAEHGAWIRAEGQWRQDETSLRGYRDQVMQVLHRYADRTPGAIVEEKGLAIVWHYRNVPPELAYARNLNLRHDLNLQLEGSDIGVYNGEKIIEIRPRSISKGAAVDELLAVRPAGFVLCIGDDYTDEDMFAAAPDNAYTIRVGLEDTLAAHQVATVEQVLTLLRSLRA